ncbi:hypothetical protein BJ508DRAFT_73250 [Ascobolus immersus RN42]|uniref:Uncharacterized protein n=1 Tax=Ascobolus immersus RN42 TaxID=1160509 RepID=A0A3N4HE08_ASCIM|nr:hypothetical protein BJ508DRAFT_73250 [Ascobolus immersus RN42]
MLASFTRMAIHSPRSESTRQRFRSLIAFLIYLGSGPMNLLSATKVSEIRFFDLASFLTIFGPQVAKHVTSSSFGSADIIVAGTTQLVVITSRAIGTIYPDRLT